jgi:hypothetical protein
MVYNKEYFSSQVDTIIPSGFKRIIKYENVFIRELNDRTERIDYTGRNYFPHGVYFQGVIISISFNSVEYVLKQVLDKYQIKQRYGDSTIHAVLHNVEGIDYSKFDTEINDDASFQIVAREIVNIVEKGALPFFEKYNTLEKVFDETEKMPISEMANFIGQPLPQRRMIIKKLCMDPNYGEYVKQVTDYYRSENDSGLFIIEKINDYLNHSLDN